MKERPITFSGEMVKAILDGRKTQTRRVIKPQPTIYHPHSVLSYGKWKDEIDCKLQFLSAFMLKYCPYGKPGDQLWVRETWKAYEIEENGLDGILYKVDDGFKAIENTVAASDAWIEVNYRGLGKWQPSIFMPRWASRITLEITGVRVERVQEITPADCKAEGIFFTPPQNPTVDEALHHLGEYKQGYAELWDSLNAKRGYSWDSNPWCWVLEFARIQP